MSFKLNLQTRDLEFDKNNNFAIADKSQDLQQRIVLKLELDRGEWFLNDTGIPWSGIDGIMSTTGEEQINLARYWITKTLKYDKAVVEIQELDIYKDNVKNELIINFTVLCTDENEYTMTVRKGAA